MSGIIVDENYTVNEKYGKKYYSITVDSPGFNQPIHHWSAQCRIFRKRKIEKLRQQAVDYAKDRLEAEQIEYKKVDFREAEQSIK